MTTTRNFVVCYMCTACNPRGMDTSPCILSRVFCIGDEDDDTRWLNNRESEFRSGKDKFPDSCVNKETMSVPNWKIVPYDDAAIIIKRNLKSQTAKEEPPKPHNRFTDIDII